MALADVVSSTLPEIATADDNGPRAGRGERKPWLLGRASTAARSQRAWLYPSLPPALLTLAICFYMFRLPNVLYGTNQYDDGVYIGAALRLTHGVIPYRDFVIVHPPGIMILLAPAALLGRILGTNVALSLSRELTAVVASLNVVLAGAVVRHRGWKVSLVAATAMACFPVSPAADSTVFLEPYLVFFCLLGFVLLFSNGSLASPRRCLLAGLSLGFAGTVKIWAATILLAVAVICIRHIKVALLPLVFGSAIGFALPCLPFFVAAPHSFVRDILGDQFSRAVSGGTSASWIRRLSNLTGMTGITTFRVTAVPVVAVSTLFLLVVGILFVRRRRNMAPADNAVLSATIASVVALSLPHEMYAHYVYFSAPFLSMLLAICIGELLRGIRSPLKVQAMRSAAVTIAGCTVAAAFLVPQQAGYARSHLASAKDPTFLNLFVPPDACTLTDNVSLLISADLFDPRRHGCPTMTDAFGTWLSDGPAQEPAYSGTARFGSTVQGPFSSHFTNEWAEWLSKSEFLVTMSQYSGYIPWNSALASWFNGNFRAIYHQPHLWIYKRVARTPAPLAR